MARLVPAQPRPGTSPRLVRMLEQLRTGLDDGWTLVHGASWVGRSRPQQPLQDGALDLLLAHPDRGIFGLQTVPGGLRHEPSGDRWSTADGTRVPDPYRTAEQSVAVLLNKLAEHPGALPSRPSHGHGVILPDVVAPTRGFAPHAPADITLDLPACDHLPRAVERLAERWQRQQPAVGNAPSRWWWRALEDLFLMPREARVLLRHRIEQDQRDLVALSDQQLQVLDMLARVRRQAIYGPAGTGKTLLAMHKARLLARQGMRVLLTCYNKALGQHIHAAMADEPNVVALHFHELCYELAELDRDRLRAPDDDRAKRGFFDEELAQRLLEGAGRTERRFDALIVDEAQDFLPLWWQALHAWLEDPARAVRYSFFDPAQRLRTDAAPVEGADEALTLLQNWRNTGHIHAHLSRVQPEVAAARCLGPPGPAVENEPLRPNPGRALRRVLGRVCGEGGVAVDDVVVLTGRNPSRSHLLDLQELLLPYRLTVTDDPGAVRLRGVQSFKGMEAPVVVLAELDHYPHDKLRQLHYIGASRATTMLVVLDDAAVPELAS